MRARRVEGFVPAVVIGVPGVADPPKPLSIAARIGVKDAKRFLTQNLRFVTGLAKSGGFYKPTSFVEALAPLVADPAARVTGLHLFTFNAVEAAESWAAVDAGEAHGRLTVRPAPRRPPGATSSGTSTQRILGR